MSTLPPGCNNRYVPLPVPIQKTMEPPCGPYPNKQYYKPEFSPPYDVVKCMTEEELNSANEVFCGKNETYAEFFEEPKMADQNFKCDGNNFIESETGYRQATQCVCAPYKSSHIHFVT